MRAALKWIPGAILALIIGAASVGPEAAVSNLSKWASMLGVHDLPTWLITKAIDRTAIISSTALLVVYVIVVWVIPYSVRHAKTYPATVLPIIAIFLFIGGGIFWGYLRTIPIERRLSADQRAEIVESFKPIAPSFPPVVVMAADNPESRQYGMDFMEALAAANIKVPNISSNVLIPGQIVAASPHLPGVFIQVQHKESPPPNAIELHDILLKSKIDNVYFDSQFLGPNDFILTVGLP